MCAGETLRPREGEEEEGRGGEGTPDPNCFNKKKKKTRRMRMENSPDHPPTFPFALTTPLVFPFPLTLLSSSDIRPFSLFSLLNHPAIDTVIAHDR